MSNKVFVLRKLITVQLITPQYKYNIFLARKLSAGTTPQKPS